MNIPKVDSNINNVKSITDADSIEATKKKTVKKKKAKSKGRY
jgi:hypothetical protein